MRPILKVFTSMLSTSRRKIIENPHFNLMSPEQSNLKKNNSVLPVVCRLLPAEKLTRLVVHISKIQKLFLRYWWVCQVVCLNFFFCANNLIVVSPIFQKQRNFFTNFNQLLWLVCWLLCDLALGRNLLDETSKIQSKKKRKKIQSIKEKNCRLDFIKTTNLHFSRSFLKE